MSNLKRINWLYVGLLDVHRLFLFLHLKPEHLVGIRIEIYDAAVSA